MENKKQFYICVVKITVGLILLQLFRFLLTKVFFLFVPNGYATGHIPNAVIFTLLAGGLLFYRYKKGKKFFPKLESKKQKTVFVAATAVAAFLVISSLFFNSSAESVFLLLYGSVITPLFEESLFRGVLWDDLEKKCNNQWVVFIFITLMFALWHLGYIDSIYWRVQENKLVFAMFMKVCIGAVVGVFTGFARKKSGGIYYPVLLHAVWNTFAG